MYTHTWTTSVVPSAKEVICHTRPVVCTKSWGLHIGCSFAHCLCIVVCPPVCMYVYVFVSERDIRCECARACVFVCMCVWQSLEGYIFAAFFFSMPLHRSVFTCVRVCVWETERQRGAFDVWVRALVWVCLCVCLSQSLQSYMGGAVFCSLPLHDIVSTCLCVCVCVWERERSIRCECTHVCVCEFVRVTKSWGLHIGGCLLFNASAS